LNRNVIHRIGQGDYYYNFYRFGGWDSWAEQMYQIQPYTGTAQNSFNYYGSVNYTSDSTISISHYSSNNYVRLRIHTINYPRKYEFYIAVKNKFYDAISDLITIDVLCPTSGGADVSTRVSSYQQFFDKDVTGTAAYSNFLPFTITNVRYTNCGNFWKYEITGASSSLSNLQYPLPGQNLETDCTTLTSCNSIKILDTSAGRIHDITLSLHIHNGWNPISIPMQIIVSWCSIKTLTTSGNPPNLLLTRTSATNDDVNYIWALTYGMMYTTEDPVRCPILRYELQDTNNNALVHENVIITNGNDPANTRITVKNDAPYTVNIRVRGFTEEQSAYMQWQVRVCGEESLSLANSNRKFYIWGIETGDASSMADSTRYYTITQATF